MAGKHFDLDTDINLRGEQASDITIASQKAIKAYVDNAISGKVDPSEVPTVNNKKITINVNGSEAGHFTTNSSTSETINIGVPTKVSQLTNDSGYLVANDISGKANLSELATVATSGSYDDLTNKPTIPTVPTNVSAFVNDAGYLSEADIASVFTYKGTKATVDALPSSGNKKGDVWTVSADGSEYVWDGTKWEYLGQVLDLSGYQEKLTAVTHDSNTAVGSSIKPVYINSSGKATEINFSIAKSVPSDAKFTDTTYTASKGIQLSGTEFKHTNSISSGTAGTSTNSAGSTLTVPYVTYDSEGHITAKGNRTHTVTGFLTEHQSLSEYAKLTDLPVVPSEVSAFTNDAGYLTEHQDISGKANLSELSTVATSGSYNDLKNKPTIPTVNDKTITINVNNSEAGHFTTNSATSQTVNISIPTDVSAFNNDAGYLTEHQDISEYALKSEIPTVPTNVSAFTNDAGYLTAHQDLSDYQKKETAVTHTKNTAAGNTITPVYVNSSGVATALNYTIAKSVPSDAKFSDTTYTAGSGLSLSGTQFKHSNSITADTAGTSAASSGSTLQIPYVSYDSEGHVTGKGTHTHTVTGFLTEHQSLSEYYTKSELDGKLSGAMHFMGTKPSEAALPSSGNETGDMWNVTDTGANYAWDGTKWDKLSENIDLSGLVPNTRTINGKTLNSDITLTYTDVNALSASTVIPTVSDTYTSTSTDAMSGKAVYQALSSKQEEISDLEDIRSGAAAGETAVQPEDLASVATTGSYENLIDTPDLSVLQEKDTAVKFTKNTAVGSTVKPVYVASTGEATALNYTLAKSVPSDANFSDTTYSAGTGLSLSGTTFNHSNSITAGTAGTTSNSSGSTFQVPYVTYDSEGHVTGKGNRTHTVTGFLTQHQDISGKANLSELSTVATTGSYNDLNNKPSIPTVPESISAFDNDVNYITSADLSEYALSSDIPENVSELTNDAGYITSGDISGKQDADTAVKHTKNTSVGDTITPVYIATNGNATALSYTIAKSVPSDAKFSDTTYSAGTDLSLSGTTFNHKASGVTAGTTGTSTATSGSTLQIPYVTYNAQGHITNAGTHTHTVSGFLTQHQSLAGYAKTSELASVATSGNYEDLINKPSIPTIPESVSAFVNDAGYLTEHQDLSEYQKKETAVTHTKNTGVGNSTTPVYITSTGAASAMSYTIAKSVPSNAEFTDTTYTAGAGLSLSGTEFKHSNSITSGTAGTSAASSGSTLTVPYVTYDAQGHITAKGTRTHTVTGFLTSHQDISGKANLSELATVATTGSYNDLSNKPTIPTVPTDVSAFNNDAGYLTEHQSLSEYYTKSEINGKLSGAMHFLGTKPSEAALPSSGNQTGDMWNVESTGANYAWDGTQWDKLSENIDLSGVVPTSRTINGKTLTSNITLTYSDVNALSSSTVIPTVSDTYTSTSSNAMSGKAVYSAVSGKQDTISDLSTIRANASEGAAAATTISGYGDIVTHNASEFLTEHQDISGKANLSELATVATSGSYSDLKNKPSIPTVPESVSAFANDAGYITDSALSGLQSADTAVKHTKNTAAGNTITPVYVASNGTATALSYTIAKSVPSDADFTNTTYSAGTGLSLSGTTFKHTNSVTSGTAGTNAATSGSTLAVPYVTYDSEGHITATGTHTHTVSGFLTSSDVTDTYSATGTSPVNGKAVKSAIDGLSIPTTTNAVTSNSSAALTSGGAYTNLITAVAADSAAANKIKVTKAGSTTSITINDVAHATSADSATNADSATSATTATKLGSSNVGNTITPIYLNGGTPTALGYTIAKSVPSDADFSNTTYTAGTDLSLSGTTFNHKASGVTAGTAGGSTASSGSTVTIPYVTYNAQGHITAAGTKTHTVTGFVTTSDLTAYAKTSELSSVATSGSYNDLEDKPTIPDVSTLQPSNTAVKHTASTAVGNTITPVYVASDGTATALSYTIAKSVPSNANFDNTTYTAGSGLSLSGTEFKHTNSVTSGTAGTSTATSGSTLAVPYVTYDATGHITATGTHTHTVSGFAASSHNHASSEINALTGYTIASASASVTTSDSLNTALGKLEYKCNHASVSTITVGMLAGS